MATRLKRIRKSSKYKYVALFKTKEGVDRWVATIMGNTKSYDTEKEAALSVDKKLINKGKDPVNILIRKKF